MLIFYATATDKFIDDLHFMTTNPLQDGLIAMNINVYHNWSSRMIIYPVMVSLSLAHIWLWRILDLAIWLLLAVSISKLFTKHEDASSNWFLAALMMVYPYWHMATAGWIASTTNFTWPLAFGMFVFLTLKLLWKDENLPIYHWILFVLALLYASDAEQKLMILIIVFTLLSAYQLYAKPNKTVHYKRTLYIGLAFLVVRLIFTLTAPGNHARRLAGHFTTPGFEYYSLWEQMLLSFELSVILYSQLTIVLFPFFALLLLIIVWNIHTSIYKRVIAVVPLAISITLSAIHRF